MDRTLPIVAIIGRPNVGKSTLFNRLLGKKIAVTTDIPGTTTDRLYERVSWQGRDFILADTAGIEYEFKERFAEDIMSQIEMAILDAHLIVFMVDVKSGITPQDQNALRKLRKSKKKAILVVNKVDNQERESSLAEFYKLGLGEPTPISALSGRGTGDLLDNIINEIENIKTKDKRPEEKDSIKVSIIGRPNVGKSSVFNTLVNENRAIVSEIPGTTRDVVTTQFDYENNKIDFIDTAGLRRRGKIGKAISGVKKEGEIEKYSTMRSLRAMEESDIVLIIIDGTEGVVSQDLHLAGFAKDSGKGIVLVVNKTDIADEITVNNFLPVLKNRFKFIPFASVVFVSAKTKKNVNKIFDLILSAKEKRGVKIPTPKLNKFLEKATLERPPVGLKKIRPKFKYITQKDTDPPTFVIFTSQSEYIHKSYIRYLENKLRKEFDFTGTAIRIEFREK